MKKIFKKISVIFLSSILFMNVVAFSLSPAVSAAGDYHGFDTLEEYEAARKAAEEAARKAEEEEAKKAAHEAAVKAEEEMKAKEAAEEAARKAAEEAARKAAEEEEKKAAEEALKKAEEEMKAKEAAAKAAEEALKKAETEAKARKAAEETIKAAEEEVAKATGEESKRITEEKDRLINSDTEVGKALKEAIEAAKYEEAKNVAERNAASAAIGLANAEMEIQAAEEKLAKANETLEFAKRKFGDAPDDAAFWAGYDLFLMAQDEYDIAKDYLDLQIATKAAIEETVREEAERVKKENELMNSLLQVVSVFGKVSGQSQEETDATIFSLEPRLWKNRHILINLDKINTKGTTGAYTSVCLKLKLTDENYYIITGTNPSYEPRIELNIMIPIAMYNIPVKEVGSGAFKGSRVKHIVIPDNIVKIGSEAFADCKKLKEIRYYGTMEQWKNIEFGEDWDKGTDNYYIRCSDGVIYK